MDAEPAPTEAAARFERRLTLTTIVLVIAAATVLAYYDKLDAGVAALFGTLVGYVIGRARG